MRSTLFCSVFAGAMLLAVAAAAAPIVGASANTLPAGQFMIDGWFTWRDYTCMYEDSSETWYTLSSERTITAGTLMPRVCYGLTDWLSLRAGISIEDRYLDFKDLDDTRSSTGIGDFVFDPKIKVYQGEEGYPRASLIVGVRIPTGDTDADVPLSDGSTDYVAGAALTHKAGDVMAHVCLTYWLNGEGEDGADVKDVWVGSLSLETPIDESWSMLWEAKAYAGSEDSDYRRLYACPGLSWNGEHATVGLSAMISAYRKGDPAVSASDFDWAPYIRYYYRFF
jgi:hypothetical protein